MFIDPDGMAPDCPNCGDGGYLREDQGMAYFYAQFQAAKKNLSSIIAGGIMSPMGSSVIVRTETSVAVNESGEVYLHESAPFVQSKVAAAGLGGLEAASIIPEVGPTLGAVAKNGKAIVNELKNVIKQIGPAGDPGATVTKQIPGNYIKKTSDNGQGTKFQDPKNPSGNNVRVQSGNPNSPNPAQQKPYVKQTQNGKTVDGNGNQVNPKSKEAHIPREDFKFKK
ncbi:hypothetical protein [Pontibacter pudoricolor]|uniref:hypothetical protein n=1 Tax=Pontibacter pudoricolor TaxID=2694930 RepID=UPI001EE4C775|nr:hypothetical protein [Pontibacter pudoricolor]